MVHNSEDYYIMEENRPRACDRCGGQLTFKGLGEYWCEVCRNVMYDDYGKVRNFLDQYPGATIYETSEATGVNEKVIKAMLRAERLQVAENSRVNLKCKGCGKPIQSGFYCPVCLKLAEAADKKRRDKEHLEERQKHIQGLAMALQNQDGKKRFTHDHE